MLEYFAFVISFLGIFVGVYLRKIAREEIKYGLYGPKYFFWMKLSVLFLILLLSLFFAKAYLKIITGALPGFILGLFITEYFFLGLVMAVGFLLNKNLFFLVSSLTFLYGFPFGSSIITDKPKKIIISAIFYLIPLIILLINIGFQQLISSNIDLLLGLISGGCLGSIIKYERHNSRH